ncbi:unnamed protein product [Symbiodinium sp. CCMP2592]|nr:unnamed protein product [Symbiodinium sp. CCMP2592]
MKNADYLMNPSFQYQCSLQQDCSENDLEHWRSQLRDADLVDLLGHLEQGQDDLCGMDAAVGRLKVIWEHSVVGFNKAPGDGVMKVELPQDQGTCILCTQPGKQEACSQAAGMTDCKEVLKDGLSKSGFPWSWAGVKCTSCKAALVTVAGGAQVILDASGEGEAQAAALLSTAAVLKAAAAASGKSLGEAALRNRVAMGALTSLAMVMSFALNKVGVLPMSPDEAQPCFVDWMLDNLEMVFLTAGQGVLPGLAALVADWKCCSSDRYRNNCGRNRKDNDPEPPRTTTPEPSQTVLRVSEAVKAGEAMAQNTLKELANFRATRAFASPDWKQMDRVHWKEITDQKYGAFCAKDAAPKVASTAQQKRTQQENELEWQVCWCAAFCQTWLASSTPPGSVKACYETLERLNLYGKIVQCSGAWWKELRKQQGQPIETTHEPAMYNAHPYGGFKIQAPPGVKVLLSFGGRTQNFYDGPSASDIGLERARRLKALLTQKYDPVNLDPNFVYIDADALNNINIDGRYTNANGRTLNVYWEQYYKNAMHNARLIIFLVDKAWLLSRNCFEELAWAQGKQLCTKHNEWPYKLDMCNYEEKEFESTPFVDAPAPLRIVAFLGQEALEHRGGAGKACPEHSLQGYGDTSGQCMSMAGFEEMPCDELSHDYDIQLQNVMDLVEARKAEWFFNSRRLTTII